MEILQKISLKWRFLGLLFIFAMIGLIIWFVLDSPFHTDDHRWLTKEPCAPPCWEKITPGITTAEEAEKFLRQNELISDVKIFSPKNRLQDSSLFWTWRSTKTLGEVYFDGLVAPHTVKRIFVNLSRPVKLKDLIAAFGYPSHVRVGAGTPNIMEEPRPIYDLSFYYIQSGFYINLGRSSDALFIKPIISPETTFGTVTFFHPSLDGLSAAFGRDKNLIQGTLVPWQGMLDFDAYCQLQFKEEMDRCK